MTVPDSHRPPPTSSEIPIVRRAATAGPAQAAWLVVKTILARMRFLAILVGIGVVMLNWSLFLAYYERWTRPLFGQAGASPDTEFWCPMHPTIVREHPDKCPICGMPLSKRKKGEQAEDEPLPAGVVSRVQITPYRVALAGIRTEPAQYRTLTKEIRTVGFVTYDERALSRITAKISGKSRIDKLFVNITGQPVEKGEPLALLYSPDLIVTVQNLTDARKSNNPELLRLARERLQLWGIAEDQIKTFLLTDGGKSHFVVRSPVSGHVIRKNVVEGDYVEEGMPLFDVADLSTVWIEAQVYEDEVGFLKKGMAVQARARSHPHRVFHGEVAFLYPTLDAGSRTLTVRFDVKNPGLELRPDMWADVSLQVPVTQLQSFVEHYQNERLARTALAALREAWAVPGMALPHLGAEELLEAALGRARLDRSLVLAVPESAVIDTGTRKIVYREVERDVYEGVEVALGPRCEGYYPVIHGLHAGDVVVTAGAFLIDAETRLTGGLGSTYFGASGGPQQEKDRPAAGARPSMADDLEDKIAANLSRLLPRDRKAAEEQKYCPVLKNSRLGSMGVPVKVTVEGMPVFLCCKGCRKQALDHPKKTLAAVERLRSGTSTADTPAPKTPETLPEEEKAIRDELSKLPPSVRKLVEAQKYCAVQTNKRLGSMGEPVRLRLRGQDVFLCCEGCEPEARAQPERVLSRLRKLKAQSSAGK